MNLDRKLRELHEKHGHPIVRLDGIWNDVEGLEGALSVTCAVPPGTNFKDVGCGQTMTDYSHGGSYVPEDYKLLGEYEGKKYYRLEPRENKNPMREMSK